MGSALYEDYVPLCWHPTCVLVPVDILEATKYCYKYKFFLSTFKRLFHCKCISKQANGVVNEYKKDMNI